MPTPITDPVLPVLVQVEEALAIYVKPTPYISNPFETDVTDDQMGQLKNGTAVPNSTLDPVTLLLGKLYEVEFIKTVGTSIGDVLGEVSDFLKDLGDKLEAIQSVSGGVQGLEDILAAIQNIPGSPPALATAIEFLTQMTDLLDDVPSARAELYMIAQQVKAIANIFAS